MKEVLFRETKLYLLKLKDHYINEEQYVLKDIKEAASKGDLKENSDYQSAKERKEILENKIGEIDRQLADAIIIEDYRNMNSDKLTDTVIPGSLVSVTMSLPDNPKDMSWREQYLLVSALNAKLWSDEEIMYYTLDNNTKINIVSPSSIIGSTLLFNSLGDSFYLKLSMGRTKLLITSIDNNFVPRIRDNLYDFKSDYLKDIEEEIPLFI